MNINRHNYESFFLLYADKELSAAEREAVEFFVEQNPDLKEEFDQLQELILPADRLSFDKSGLFKNEDSISPLEEKMLLHIDGELNQAQAKELDALLQEDKELQDTYRLLQQTKLDPADAASYGNKNMLYRYERTRIVNMRVFRWAAAAVLLGFGLFAGVKFLSPGSSVINGTEVPVAKNGNNGIVPEDSSMKQQAPYKANIETAAAKNNTVKDNATTASESRKTNQAVPVKASLKQTNPPGDKLKEDRTNMASSGREEKKSLSASNTVQQKLTEPPLEPEKTIAQAPVKINVEDRNVTMVPLQESFARQAVFTETETAGNDKILYMNENDVTRSKTGILFRKLKRVVERNTKIKPGKNLKIAGFEIAAR